MSPTAPAPKKESTVDQEIDDAIAKIDACLPEIHRKVAAVKNGESDDHLLDTTVIRKSQTIFRAMADNPLLTDSGEDIQVKAPPKRKKG